MGCVRNSDGELGGGLTAAGLGCAASPKLSLILMVGNSFLKAPSPAYPQGFAAWLDDQSCAQKALGHSTLRNEYTW